MSHSTDCSNDMVLTDQQGTLDALKAQFGRPVVFQEGCLPQGRYTMNLVYGTGQAWSDPNEAGVCQAGETESADHSSCAAIGPATAKRARLRPEIRPDHLGTERCELLHRSPDPAGVLPHRRQPRRPAACNLTLGRPSNPARPSTSGALRAAAGE